MYRRILLLFFASGALGLGYQVLWSKLILLFVGVSAWSYAIVLAAFMTGLALGSWRLGRLADRVASPLTLFAYLELGVGLYAVAYVPLAHAVERLHAAWVRLGPEDAVGSQALWPKALASGLLLLPPTILMGGTFPALLRHAARDVGAIGRRASQLYAVNALGAVVGALVLPFFVMPALGVQASLMLLALGNAAVGLTARLIAQRERAAAKAAEGEPPPVTTTDSAEPSPAAGPSITLADTDAPAAARPGMRLVLPLLLAAGFLSFALEIAWTRTFSIILGSSTYSFAVIVAAFIGGIALGGALLSRVEARLTRPFAALGWAQLAAAAMVLLPLGAYPVLPWFLARASGHLGTSGGAYAAYELLKLATCAAVMLPPTVFIGTSLPLAIKALALRPGAVGSDAGRACAWNTAGNVAGALVGGLVLLSALGMERMILWTAVGMAVVGSVAVVSSLPSGGRRLRAVLAATGAVVLLALAAPRWDPGWFTLVPFRHRGMPSWKLAREAVKERHVVMFEDDPAANVLVMTLGEGASGGVALLVNGKPDASTAEDMPTQLLLGHLPMLLHPRAEDVLVIGLASGVTSGAVLRHDVKRLDVVDIVRAMPRACDRFRAWNGAPLEDPRTTFVADDARSFVARARGRYDVVISEPSNPWTAGTGSLFSTEFFAHAVQSLKPGGIYVQWVQAYELSDETLAAIVRSFRSAFPNVLAFEASTLDMLLVGSASPLAVDRAEMSVALARPAVAEQLAPLGLTGAAQVLFLQQFSPVTAEWIAASAAVENTDDNLLLEYQAPRDLFSQRTPAIAGRLDERRFASPSLAWSQLVRSGDADLCGAMRVMARHQFGTGPLLAASRAGWDRSHAGSDAASACTLPADAMPKDAAPRRREDVAVAMHDAAAVGDVGALRHLLDREMSAVAHECLQSRESAEWWLGALVEAASVARGDTPHLLTLARIEVLSAAGMREEALKVLRSAVDGETPPAPGDGIMRACRLDPGATCLEIARTYARRTHSPAIERFIELRAQAGASPRTVEPSSPGESQ